VTGGAARSSRPLPASRSLAGEPTASRCRRRCVCATAVQCCSWFPYAQSLATRCPTSPILSLSFALAHFFPAHTLSIALTHSHFCCPFCGRRALIDVSAVHGG
jgi:hypothetical protein